MIKPTIMTTFTQATPATVWTVPVSSHDPKRCIQVFIKDAQNATRRIIPQDIDASGTSIVITFSVPYAGTVVHG